MTVLDNAKEINKYDKTQVIESISLLADQIKQAWQETGKITLPEAYIQNQNIVFCGMGGSNLASELIRQAFSDQLNKPMFLIRDYHLPLFVNQNTIVFVSSYSGNTEESVSCLKEAIKRQAKIICLAAGGEIINLAKQNNLPFYVLPTKNNPSNQPRYGLGSQLGSLVSFLVKLKTLKIEDKKMMAVIDLVGGLNNIFGPQIERTNNPAKLAAEDLVGSMPILVAAEHLSANIHILANQINESGKSLAVSFGLPELNHHLLEGLSFPESVIKKVKFLFLTSNIYSSAIKKRVLVTQKVLKKQNIPFIEQKFNQPDKLSEALEVLVFGSWLSFYLAVLNKQDPAQIPWVNFFKQEMK